MDGFAASMARFEAWLKVEIGPDFVAADLAEKHRRMRADPFAFLRATYWRWAQTILDTCPELADAPEIPAIGDTHLENFGTWRDADARLVWGVNDFDDAAIMPYPLDLVRLAASALLARGDDGPAARDICRAIVEGYAEGLRHPAPLVLERDHKWLRQAVMLPETERTAFWRRFDALARDPAPHRIPRRYRDALVACLPDGHASPAIAPRTAGLGSLGRPRFVAACSWRGGPVLREAKAVVLSGWALAHTPHAIENHAGQIAAGRFRAPDPHYRIADGIALRRLSPNSRKIEVETAPAELLSTPMLRAMGHEIANCHAGHADRLPALRQDLERRGDDWLRRAAKAAARRVEADSEAFR